ncbi:MAG: endolytic transglycosylase MltG [Paludibacter sp.]|nr:endolytic transglycosylase MltG [Paludibacter sp.]
MTTKKKIVKQSKNSKKVIKWISFIVISTVLYFAYILFAPNIFSNSLEKSYLCIPDSSRYIDVTQILKKEANVINMSSFKQASNLLRYGTKIRPGRYELKKGMNNFQLIRILRSGRQTPVKLSFNNIRTKEQLAGRLGKQLMTDSTSILLLLNDSSFLAGYNLNPNTSVSLFIPNTYEVFWNINAKKLFERMDKEYLKFWTNERKDKAAAIPLSLAEVSTLASIVEEETNNKKDQPMVAGLYINRLKTNMPLQADPTVKFALGDFSIKRILYGHLKINSPYNTYKNTGLPPGPIRIATPKGIDAVLNYSHHNYIYMCASETLNGEHKFAKTWDEHKINANKYQQELNRRAIFK